MSLLLIIFKSSNCLSRVNVYHIASVYLLKKKYCFEIGYLYIVVSVRVAHWTDFHLWMD